MIPLPVLFLIGVPLNAFAAFTSLWRKSVDPGGALCGAVLGTAVFVLAGPGLWLLLAAFVMSSSTFTRFRAEQKAWLSELHEKGGRRDLVQVLANGGVGLVMAALFRLTGEPACAVGFAAALASANADTWASEIGVLSRREPISLVTFRPVPRGMSGGVTLLGLAASFAGAFLIALLFALASLAAKGSLTGAVKRGAIVTAAGLLGSLIDSVLGFGLQARYKAGVSETTERRVTDGATNRLVHGLPWITNDLVNALSTAFAAGFGFLLSRIPIQS